MAPEIDYSEDSEYGPEVDIFSLGVVAYLLVSGGNYPFYSLE